MTHKALLSMGGSSWRWRMSAGGILRELLASRGTVEAPLYGAAAADLDLIRDTRCEVPLLMNDISALQILMCVRAAMRLGGAMAEAGVMMGGSAKLICEAKGSADLHLFDVFDQLQGSGPKGAGPESELRSHFGDVAGDLSIVERLLKPYSGVHIHPGIFPDTGKGFEQLRFSFVHLDLDLATSTRAALDWFYPRLLAGGILIGDDFEDPQVSRTFRDYLAARPDTFVELAWGQVMVVKTAV